MAPGGASPPLNFPLLAWLVGWQGGQASLPFVVVLGAAGLAGWPGPVHKEDHSPGTCPHHRWFLALPQIRGLLGARRRLLLCWWEPQGLARRQPSWAGGHWPLKGGGA